MLNEKAVLFTILFTIGLQNSNTDDQTDDRQGSQLSYRRPDDQIEAVNYLLKYGYLTGSNKNERIVATEPTSSLYQARKQTDKKKQYLICNYLRLKCVV